MQLSINSVRSISRKNEKLAKQSYEKGKEHILKNDGDLNSETNLSHLARTVFIRTLLGRVLDEDVLPQFENLTDVNDEEIPSEDVPVGMYTNTLLSAHNGDIIDITRTLIDEMLGQDLHILTSLKKWGLNTEDATIMKAELFEELSDQLEKEFGEKAKEDIERERAFYDKSRQREITPHADHIPTDTDSLEGLSPEQKEKILRMREKYRNLSLDQSNDTLRHASSGLLNDLSTSPNDDLIDMSLDADGVDEWDPETEETKNDEDRFGLFGDNRDIA